MPAGNNIIDMIRYIRMDIGDDGSTETYSDTQLITMVSKATIRLDADIAGGLNPATSGGFIAFEQATSGSTFLPSGVWVLPTGASASGLPNQLFNLTMLRSECMIAKRAHFDAAGKAIRVRDGDTEIDTSVGFGGLADLTSGKGGPCAEYKETLDGYLKWLNGQLNGDITQYAAIVWKGSFRSTASHVEPGIDGQYRVEKLGDFGEYLTGMPTTTDNVKDAGEMGPDGPR